MNFDDTVFTASDHGRMWGYIWQNIDGGDPKWGEHWVNIGEVPYDSLLGRIKGGAGQNYSAWSVAYPVDELDQKGSLKIHWLVDVTDWAMKHCPEKCHQRGGVDNVLRDRCLIKRVGTSEFHKMEPEDMISELWQELKVAHKPQELEINNGVIIDTLLTVVNSLLGGARVIACDLCPRFGKTLWSMLVAHFTNTTDVIVASYVYTVWGSYISQVPRYSKFIDWVFIDMRKDNWREKYEQSVKSGSKRVWFCPLVKSGSTEDRYRFLQDLRGEKLWVVEEADIATHTPKVNPGLQKAVGNDRVLIESGTHMERAIKPWRYDKYVRVSYFQLIVKQREENL